MGEFKIDPDSAEPLIEISNEHFLRVQKMAHLGSWKMDLNNEVIHATDEALRIFGLKKSVLDFKEAQAVPLPEYRAALDKEMSDLIKGCKAYDIEYRIKRPSDGEIRYIHSLAEFNEMENTIIGVFQDVTERKEMELALARSEERYRSIFDNSVSGIIYSDLEGRLLEANRNMLKMLGSPSLEETKKINILTFPLLVETGFSADFQRVVDTSEAVSNSNLYRSKWGTEHYLEYHLTPINNAGIIAGIMGKIEDVTERTLAEQKIESLLKEKDIILREVHHRIKNNMASIEALLRIQMENNDEKNVCSALKEASGRLSSMRILYENLFESEDFMEMSSYSYLTKLIDEIIDVFPESGDIRIEKQFDDFMIPSEKTFSLGIIINELLTNAIKYAFSDEMAEKIISIYARKEGSEVNITVRDNGKGFAGIAGSGESSGFGMQLIRMLSEQIGGTADFYNDHGAYVLIKFEV